MPPKISAMERSLLICSVFDGSIYVQINKRFDYCSIIFLNGDIHYKQKGSILYGVLTDNVVTYMSSQVYSVH